MKGDNEQAVRMQFYEWLELDRTINRDKPGLCKHSINKHKNQDQRSECFVMTSQPNSNKNHPSRQQ